MGGLTAVWTTNLAPQGCNWPIGGHNWQWTQIRSELRSLVWGPGNPQSYGRFPWPLGERERAFLSPKRDHRPTQEARRGVDHQMSEVSITNDPKYGFIGSDNRFAPSCTQRAQPGCQESATSPPGPDFGLARGTPSQGPVSTQFPQFPPRVLDQLLIENIPKLCHLCNWIQKSSQRIRSSWTYFGRETHIVPPHGQAGKQGLGGGSPTCMD